MEQEKIEIKGEYPEWKIAFKDKSYPIYIPTRVRPLQGDELRRYIKSSLQIALAQRFFEKYYSADAFDMQRIWQKFCIYNNWECPC